MSCTWSQHRNQRSKLKQRRHIKQWKKGRKGQSEYKRRQHTKYQCVSWISVFFSFPRFGCSTYRGICFSFVLVVRAKTRARSNKRDASYWVFGVWGRARAPTKRSLLVVRASARPPNSSFQMLSLSVVYARPAPARRSARGQHRRHTKQWKTKKESAKRIHTKAT